MPDTFYCSAFQKHLELTPTHYGEDLAGCRHSVLALKQRGKRVVHPGDVAR
ncbi:hypothetical protein [Mycolicibacterium sphagni]|uniref:hypothetical protein n=1 Tax=Mycolicibacterium sphagni TaxID=1786 RepID=UPI001F2FAA7A|nr:hypothetical protein [Mycolicibacterium sphagni]